MNLTVAFQGERGAFSEEAARKLLGSSIEAVPCRTFEDVFASVTTGRVACALLPIENSLAGSVVRNYELLAEQELTIRGEVYLRISHNLIAKPGTKLADVREAHSHPVALAQCQRFVAQHKLEPVAAYDTAGAVKDLMADSATLSNHENLGIRSRQRSGERASRPQSAGVPPVDLTSRARRAPRAGETPALLGARAAAIAGRLAAELYGGEIIASEIEDHPENFTRFLLLTKPGAPMPAIVGGAPKTSLFFRTPNKPGALFRALAAFALRDVNMNKIESRPIVGRPWDYSFYVDISGDTDDPNVARAIDHLREMCEVVRVLGCYPSGS